MTDKEKLNRLLNLFPDGVKFHSTIYEKGSDDTKLGMFNNQLKNNFIGLEDKKQPDQTTAEIKVLLYECCDLLSQIKDSAASNTNNIIDERYETVKKNILQKIEDLKLFKKNAPNKTKEDKVNKSNGFTEGLFSIKKLFDEE